MNYTAQKIAKDLAKLAEKYPDKQAQIATNFVDFCQQKNLLGLLPHVQKKLNTIYSKNTEKQKTKITLAHKADQKITEKIQNYINKKNNNQPTVNIDEKILGGFILEQNNLIYDSSLKQQLNTLKNKLQAKI